MYRRPRSVVTNSGIQVRREIEFSGVGKWRRYIISHVADMTLFNNVCHPTES